MKKRVLSFLFYGLLVMPTLIRAQECPQFPADCPTDMSSIQDSMNCIQALIVPEEILMQNQLRSLISGSMQRIADEKHWRLYEYAESADYVRGPGVDPNTGNALPLAYSLRKPHQFDLSFIFIISEDSLKAWQDWYHNDLIDKSQDVVDQYKQQGSDQSYQDQLKSYLDSANYYADLKAKYLNDHATEYQQAIISNNQNAIKKIEAGSKQWDKKSDYWIAKAGKKQDTQLATANQSAKDLQQYRLSKTISFRNASMIRVKFLFNQSILQIADQSGIMQINRRMNIPNATRSILFRNNRPDEKAIYDLNQFNRSPDLGILLYGQWNSPNDLSFTSAFSKDQKSMDQTSQKRIGSDKVRTVAIVMEGSASELVQLAGLINHFEINRLITP